MRSRRTAHTLQTVVEQALGMSLPLRVRSWDGSEAGPEGAPTLVVRRPGMRLLDVGCGWGSMAIHAAREHGVQVVGVTLPQQ